MKKERRRRGGWKMWSRTLKIQPLGFTEVIIMIKESYNLYQTMHTLMKEEAKKGVGLLSIRRK